MVQLEVLGPYSGLASFVPEGFAIVFCRLTTQEGTLTPGGLCQSFPSAQPVGCVIGKGCIFRESELISGVMQELTP